MKTCPVCKMRYPNEGKFCLVDRTELVNLADDRLGTVVAGRYLIERVIGEGGMATVYRAHNRLVDRACAIKVMNPALATDQVVRERFRREAKNAQKLSHPNIIEIYDQGDTNDGTAYIAMELLEGLTLAELVHRGAIELHRGLNLMIQTARGIARAHDFEVIHRDLKPENIFVCRREDGSELVKLLDFGIARSRHDSRLTGAGELFGTPQYMAPERITSGESSTAVDLYALGVIFFEILTRRLPFDAPDLASLFVKHINEAPPSPRSVNRQLPEALDQLVLSLLAKDPKARPVDAHRVRKELIAIAKQLGTAIPPESEADSLFTTSNAGRTAPRLPEKYVRRTRLLEQLVNHAFAGKPPPEFAKLVTEAKGIASRATTTQVAIAKLQDELVQIELRARESRQRYGSAVDSLGLDLSRARDEARVSRAMALLLQDERSEAAGKFAVVQKEIITWEGRSGMQEPYAELSGAYRHAAEVVDSWRRVADEHKKANAAAEAHEAAVGDLEFQIAELRGALSKAEQELEVDSTACERKAIEQNRDLERLDAELAAIGGRLIDSLKARPELAPIIKELEAEAAA